MAGGYWGGVGWLMLAGAARSNGVLGVWFLGWWELVRRRGGGNGNGNGNEDEDDDEDEDEDEDDKRGLGRRIWRVVVGGAVVCLPYVCMQVYGWWVFCTGMTPAALATRPGWCDRAVPSIYGYIQNAYWDVGFLNFYQKLIRLPFVVQSIPVIVLAVGTCWAWTFGPWMLVGRAGRDPALRRLLSLGRVNLEQRLVDKMRGEKTSEKTTVAVVVEELVAPFVYHLALMTFVSIFVMHVNVATRFLSSSPLLFWGAAQWVINGGAWRWRLLLAWCASYLAVGALMFPNFYPWV